MSLAIRIFFDRCRIEYVLIRRKLQNKGLLKRVFILSLVVAFLFLIGMVLSNVSSVFDLQELARSAGFFAPLIIILFIILEVIFAPIPGTFIMVASGALFGVWLGALYTYIGNIIGSLIAFVLAKYFGRDLVERLVSKKALSRYDEFFLLKKKWLLFFYMLPVIPVDILSFVCGLSALSWRRFLLIILVGFIPNTLILAFLGDKLAALSLVSIIVYSLVFLLIFSLLAWLFRLVIKRFSA